MKKLLIFIHGAGDEGYEADAELVASLRQTLGEEYEVRYPKLTTDESRSDFGWPEQIQTQLDAMEEEFVLVGHSLGASFILKCLSERTIKKAIRGVFLIAAPFWAGEEDWKQGLKLQEGFASRLPVNVPVFLYHSRDDEEVPFSHLETYAQKLPHATVREVEKGGHQLNNDLSLIAADIKSL
ncbi:alpha/beta fold hydrolase [Pedobacter sp. SYSU D00535]|uniref:alpha/beta fold hydrolase n=1 Tax=Pedobacter sp. SYSU D00535 TaxID=2810308 RepID=UPI001A956B08|nr:alpha/beta fold hydrolase [Pedobacter sp. SYSU D00535]